MPLTPTGVTNAKPRDKAYKLSDGGGLHLLIQPNGSKLWRLAYRFEGKSKTLSIGPFDLFGVADARRARDQAKIHLAQGIDPATVMTKRKAATLEVPAERTFKDTAKEFHEIWKSGKNDDHVLRVWSRLERDAFPEIGDMPLIQVQPIDIVRMVRKVEDRGALDVSRRLKQKCGEVFGYAIAMGYATNDPTSHVNKALRPKPKPEHMPRVPLREMPELLRAIDGYRLSEIARLGLQFTLLTATRTGEVRGATWSEIDREGNLWRIPAARMKMGREHIVPLSRQTLALLKEIETHKRGEYLFPGPRRPQMNTNALINALYDLKFRGRQSVHGFRSLFSTFMNESGKFHPDAVEMQLAHNDNDEIRSAYNSAEYLPQRITMMQFWADALDEMRGIKATDDFDELLIQ